MTCSPLKNRTMASLHASLPTGSAQKEPQTVSVTEASISTKNVRCWPSLPLARLKSALPVTSLKNDLFFIGNNRAIISLHASLLTDSAQKQASQQKNTRYWPSLLRLRPALPATFIKVEAGRRQTKAAPTFFQLNETFVSAK